LNYLTFFVLFISLEIIERNAYSASQEGLKDLSKKINLLKNRKDFLFILGNRLHLIANFKMSKYK
jgi:hypothetical protein